MLKNVGQGLVSIAHARAIDIVSIRVMPFFKLAIAKLKSGDAIICCRRHGALQAFTPEVLSVDN